MNEPATDRTTPEIAKTGIVKPAAKESNGDDRIRTRAYELYEKRQGQQPGDAESDWYQAEAEIAAETTS